MLVANYHSDYVDYDGLSMQLLYNMREGIIKIDGIAIILILKLRHDRLLLRFY